MLKGEPSFKILERFFLRDSLYVLHNGDPEEKASNLRGSDLSRFLSRRLHSM